MIMFVIIIRKQDKHVSAIDTVIKFLDIIGDFFKTVWANPIDIIKLDGVINGSLHDIFSCLMPYRRVGSRTLFEHL